MDNQYPQQSLPPQQPTIPPQNVTPVSSLQQPYYGKRNWIKRVFVYLIIAALIYGGIYYYLAIQQKKSSPYSTNFPTPTISQPSPTPDLYTEGTRSATANWKTYANTKRSYEFKYPDQYKLKETEASSTTLESVYLEKDTSYTEGGGFAGSNVLKKGVIISFIAYPKKDLSESALKSEYGTDITTKIVSIGNKEGIEIIFQADRYNGRKIYVNDNNAVLETSSNSGFESSKADQETYLTDFNNILSTFKFLPGEDPTANWKTYTNKLMNFSFRYPDIYKLENEDKQKVVFSGLFEPGGQGIPAEMTVNFLQTMDSKKMTGCEDQNVTSPCLESTISIKDISGVQWMIFNVNANPSGQATDEYVAQTVNDPKIEVVHEVLGGGIQTRVDQILSTFKFTK